jgi:replicative DNA helicase
VKKLVDYSRVRDAISSIEQFLEKLDKGDIEEALRQYQGDALTLQASDLTIPVTRGDVIEDFEQRKQLIMDMQAHPDKYRGILTGIFELDRVTGGLWDGELGFFFGKSGVGKSFCLLEVALSAYRAGYKVLVIPIEMPLIQWQRRFDSRISHISYESFKWATLDEVEMAQWEERVKIAEARFSSQGGWIKIAHIPMGCTLGAVRVELELLIRRGIPADMLVIDYADLMSPPRQLYSEQGELTAIFRELKGMAGAYNIPIWTATQARREAYKSSSLNMSDVGYAMGKVHVSDLVIGVSRSDEDALSDRMILSIAKYRDGVYNKPITLTTNLALAMINAVGV